MLWIPLVLDSFIGDPPSWPHPIRFIGGGIQKLERVLRQKVANLYVAGFLLWLVSNMVCILPVLVLSKVTPPLFFNGFQIILMTSLLATRCLSDEGHRVYRVVKEGDMQKAREAVGYLVGRDTEHLQESDVCRAAVETVAENTIDGTIAPLFYMAIGLLINQPLALMLLYKTTNTLDSMVGYKQAPYTEIGYFSAKMDDVLNYLPARLGSICMLLAGALLGYDVIQGLRIFIRDRQNHKSPNSGHPESVVAGLLNIQLGGDNVYFGELVHKPTIGDAQKGVTVIHIKQAVRVLWFSQLIFALFVTGILYYGGYR